MGTDAFDAVSPVAVHLHPAATLPSPLVLGVAPFPPNTHPLPLSPRQDLSLARHVLSVHREGRAPRPEGPAPLSPELLRAYIAAAKQHDPYVPESLTDYVAAVYAEMRR